MLSYPARTILRIADPYTPSNQGDSEQFWSVMASGLGCTIRAASCAITRWSYSLLQTRRASREKEIGAGIEVDIPRGSEFRRAAVGWKPTVGNLTVALYRWNADVGQIDILLEE
ncbi:hypothetical protein PoMZ_04929 [Pyricularia oryzae]|uniref:Uncharacterized protein n=1 Tax=Pyricularia oryzae TaxID=318829 RepID=A0A4P7ND26_PYROR|nr:hypothetical protein PoMZ_04929 [Pyricularia oryzae]